MNNDNGFNLLNAILVTMRIQLGVLGLKYQHLTISFEFSEVETIPRFHLRTLHIRSETFLLQNEIAQINDLTSKYIRELSKFKHIQRYMTAFDLDFRMCGRLPQRHRLFTILHSTIEAIFENIEESDVDILTALSIIEPIFNHNIGNTFHRHNGPNQRQHIYKNTSQ